jgi:carboxyl-terminal processing protease
MKRKFVLIAVVLLSLGVLAGYEYKESINREKEFVLTDLVFNALRIAHYDKKIIDDEFSRQVFDLYIERLDYTKKFLLKNDIERLRQYRDKIDDELKTNSSEFFELSAELINQRIDDAEKYYKEILAQPFDYKKNEYIEVDDKKNDWAEDETALRDSWRKALKYQTLLEINSKLELQETAKEKNDTTIEQKSFEEIEKAAREKVRKRNEDWFRRLKQVEHFDRLSTFLNAIANDYDPHTGYFPPKDKEDFDISISGQLEGIGATLQEKDGYIKVVRVMPGSPSWKQGELKANDLILKVAQGEEDYVDVVGMRLDKAVKMIRGKKGTTVRLFVKHVDGTTQEIPIVRDVVIIEETYAKSVIVTTPETGKRIGYIYLPQFYVNFNKKDGGRRCSDDVLKEIYKLKNEKIDGMIIDLRNNGGGSLPDVVKMAGFFIKEGPIVQVKQNGARQGVLKDTDPEVYYSGPMAVMVNGNSASASEIFAAALQDYERAVIVGSKFTFGKGTVQRFIDLDQVVNAQQNDLKPFGALKLTFQKFYRINGGSTQLKGVASDIVFPDNMMYLDYGERELKHHLKWDKIEPAAYQKVEPVKNLTKIEAASQKRIDRDPDFQMIKKKAKRIKQVREETEIPLNLDKFREMQKNLKKENDYYSKLMTDTTAVKVIPLKADMMFIEKDTVKMESAKQWHKNLSKDIYIKETIHVLSDIIEQK